MSKDFRAIVLVGQLGSGKATVAKYLAKKGFRLLIFSDVVREKLARLGIKNPTRSELQDMGDTLRAEHGPQVLAELLYKKATRTSGAKFVFDGARNPAEVQYLKESGAFVLGIIADKRLRFQRLVQRAEDRDPKTWSEFLSDDARDLGVGQAKHGQQVSATLKLADATIKNNGTVSQLYKGVAELLSEK